MLQEEGYYPFGLEMKALGSQAALKQQTNYKFNAGTNLESSFDVNYYETYFRNYDAQIGRFTGIDMLAESYASFTLYNFGANNPVSVNDPTGANMAEALDQWRHYTPSAHVDLNPFDMAQGWNPFDETRGGNGDFLDNIVNTLSKGTYGGSWSAVGGFFIF